MELYSPVLNNRAVLINWRGPTDNLNINKHGRGVQIKRRVGGGGGSENCSRSKVATRYH